MKAVDQSINDLLTFIQSLVRKIDPMTWKDLKSFVSLGSKRYLCEIEYV